ncbi:MAG: DUF3006 domain-containing protein [Halanaerobiales bacterium]|nr:DUF3006 domain-containing protein [Halanaerobiales bacterium]
MMKIAVNIDRFEGDQAVLMIDGEIMINLPKKFLPEGVKPGSWLDMILVENCEKENEVRHNVENLLAKLKQGKHLSD